jgi:hypothetical protein
MLKNIKMYNSRPKLIAQKNIIHILITLKIMILFILFILLLF